MAALAYSVPSHCRIVTANYPLPKTVSDEIDSLATSQTAFNLANFLVFSFGFLTSSYCLFVVQERVVKAKHIQFVSGISATIYWVANWCWDFLTSLVPIFSILILFASFDIPGNTSRGGNAQGNWFATSHFQAVCDATPVYCSV